jgi:hypothetical protein
MRPTRLAGLVLSPGACRLGVLLACVVWSGAAVAAPFCLRNPTMAPLCIYYDASSCQREATRQGGDCTVNRDEVTVRGGVGHYCLVTSALVLNCQYPDRQSCTNDARRQNAACTDSPGVSPAKAPDPYSRQGGY